MAADTISLVILLGVIILFIINCFPSGTVALGGLMLMLIFKCCTVAEAMSGFASDIFLLVLGMLILGEAMFQSGAAQFIGYYSVKAAGGSERRFILISCLIAAAMSAFLTNTAVIALMMSICLAASEASDTIRYRNLVMPVAIAAILGGHCTMAGSTTQLTAAGLLTDAAGLTFGMWDLAAVCLPITLVTILYMTFFGRGTGEKIWGNRKEEENDASAVKIQLEKGTLSREGGVTLGIFGIVIVLFVTGVVSNGVAAMIGAVLAVMTGCVDQKKAFSRMDWNTILWLSACLGMGKALSASGAAAKIGDVLFNLFGSVSSPLALFAAMVFVTMLMSQFMSNMACLLVIMPGALDMVIRSGLNPYPFAYGMCLGAALTYLTPLANGHIGMTGSAGYRFTDYVRYSFIPTVIAYGMIVGLTPLLFPLA